MPSSLFADMDRSGSNQGDALDDQRALQIALDQLSLLGLDNDDNSLYDNEPRKKSVNMTECVPVPSSEHVAEIVGRQGCKIKALRAKTNTYIKTPVRGEEPVFVVTGRREDVAMARREIISAAEHFSMIRASRNKNISLNGTGTPAPGPPNLPGQTTIQVRVPYRVVGLVVGPKGATIKRIQQQTHTYIVTPSRDKEPIFEVTGMPENVDRAREEIEAHIAMRTGGLIELQDENDFHANGTDVGFDIHGHVTLWSKPGAGSDGTAAANGTAGGGGGGGGGATPASARKPFSNYRNDSSSSLGSASTDSYFGNGGSPRMADYSPPSPALSYTASSTATTTNNNNNGNNNNNNANNNANSGFVYGRDAVSPDCTNDGAFDASPGFEPATAPPGLLWSHYENRRGTPSSSSPGGSSPTSSSSSSSSSTAAASAMYSVHAPNANAVLASQRRAPHHPRMSPPLHGQPAAGPLANNGASVAEHPLARRVRSDPGGGPLSFTYPGAGASLPGPHHLPGVPCDSSSSVSSTSSSSSTSSGASRKGSRDCSVCFESEVIAALVPCGHNLFCMECANRICQRNEPRCPVCQASVTQAIRIFS
ncbi:RNA-binding protein MEX3B [Gadus morhua]|uniref:Mex-3 RNA binding family member B n=1 Tax=Gadus morhua TaxID=8049 RepID=A0A8C4ZVL2_GADMO|nr:RNA-binding protein MEX3B [Gadus morhua]